MTQGFPVPPKKSHQTAPMSLNLLPQEQGRELLAKFPFGLALPNGERSRSLRGPAAVQLCSNQGCCGSTRHHGTAGDTRAAGTGQRLEDDGWRDGWRTREGAPLCLVFSLNQKGEGAMVQCDEFLGTPTLPSMGGVQSLCLLLPCCVGRLLCLYSPRSTF